MEILLPVITLESLLPLLSVIAAVFVITTKNAIISVFNLIVLYILVAFYLIYLGITYIGISYIIIYIGAIAILFLFIIMMIDVEVVEKRNNNYLPLLFLLLGGFLVALKKILHVIGLVKVKTLLFEEEIYEKSILFNNIDFSFYYKNLGSENINTDEYLSFNLNNYQKNLLNEDLNEKFKDSDSYLDSFRFYQFPSNSYNHLNSSINLSINKDNYYLLINSDWNLAVNRVTQISAIGDVLYTVYHSYIYILSVILLLGMVGAIILTKDNYQKVKIINVIRNKDNSALFTFYFIFKLWCSFIFNLKILLFKLNCIISFSSRLRVFLINIFNEIRHRYLCLIFWFFVYNKYTRYKNKFTFMKYRHINKYKGQIISNKISVIPLYYQIINIDNVYFEEGNLIYFLLANIIVALLLLIINSYFSLSMKYLDKGGGFECGFTSFVQTRERFNVIFYRVSLLFLIFDLEIILAFPYTVIYQKNQNISKNNVIIFLYILVVGFIYELKEGALNIVKKAHSK